MRVGVVLGRRPFGRDRLEAQAQGLVAALGRAGHEAELIPLPFGDAAPEASAQQILASRLLDLEESMGTRIDRLIALNFPAYHVPHTARAAWVLGCHGPAYGMAEDTPPDAGGAAAERVAGPAEGDAAEGAGEAAGPPPSPWTAVRTADRRRLAGGPAGGPGGGPAGAVIAGSAALAGWLRGLGAAEAPVLRAPPARLDGEAEAVIRAGRGAGPRAPAADGDCVVLPDPEAAGPRAALALAALARCRTPVRLMIAGTAEPALRAAAAPLGARVAWCGADALPAALARGVAVLLPQRADQDGIAALEAMRAGRPVVTCADSAAAAELVADGTTGLVRAPEAAALASALDALWDDRQAARRMGEAARDGYDALHLRWEAVTARLLAR